jgi:hypothetical protein
MIPPGALTTRQAYDYCGGRRVFETLRAQFALKPFYRSSKSAVYRRADIDDAMARAALQREPISPSV